MSGYRLCPTCLRATPHEAGEVFCPIDGSRMLPGCPACGAPIHTPYARHCAACGAALAAPAGPARAGGDRRER